MSKTPRCQVRDRWFLPGTPLAKRRKTSLQLPRVASTCFDEGDAQGICKRTKHKPTQAIWQKRNHGSALHMACGSLHNPRSCCPHCCPSSAQDRGQSSAQGFLRISYPDPVFRESFVMVIESSECALGGWSRHRSCLAIPVQCWQESRPTLSRNAS